jgi:hypothetical protein
MSKYFSIRKKFFFFSSLPQKNIRRNILSYGWHPIKIKRQKRLPMTRWVTMLLLFFPTRHGETWKLLVVFCDLVTTNNNRNNIWDFSIDYSLYLMTYHRSKRKTRIIDFKSAFVLIKKRLEQSYLNQVINHKIWIKSISFIQFSW